MNRIRDLRNQLGWRQKDLAQKLSTSQQTIGRYENEDIGLDVSTINLLCDIFGCTADYLLGRSALSENQLTAEETALLVAYRRADDRARDMVNLALSPFQGKSIEGRAI